MSHDESQAEFHAFVGILCEPLLADLRRATGVPFNSTWDLNLVELDYQKVLPVLVDHLERGPYPSSSMSGVGDVIVVKEAVRFWDRLKGVWLTHTDADHQMVAARALAAGARKAQYKDLVGMLVGGEGRAGRYRFVDVVLRLGRDQGAVVLESLVDDPEVGGRAVEALERRRARLARAAQRKGS